jgi:hypothetical protein
LIPRDFADELARAKPRQTSNRSTPTDQVEDQDHYGNNEQEVDQGPSYVETEAE